MSFKQISNAVTEWLARRFAGLRPRAAGRHQPMAAAAAPVRVPAERLTGEQQWACVSDAVNGAVSGVALVRQLQSAAGQQIDSAAYALQGLLAELAAVMPVPAALDKGPVVVHLDPTPARAARPGRAAA